MEHRARSVPREPPLRLAIATWGTLATAAAILVAPRPAPALGPWDFGAQVAALFAVYVVVPFLAVYAVDVYRAHAAEDPDGRAGHALGLALTIGAGALSVGAWAALAWAHV